MANARSLMCPECELLVAEADVDYQSRRFFCRNCKETWPLPVQQTSQPAPERKTAGDPLEKTRVEVPRPAIPVAAQSEPSLSDTTTQPNKPKRPALGPSGTVMIRRPEWVKQAPGEAPAKPSKGSAKLGRSGAWRARTPGAGVRSVPRHPPPAAGPQAPLAQPRAPFAARSPFPGRAPFPRSPARTGAPPVRASAEGPGPGAPQARASAPLAHAPPPAPIPAPVAVAPPVKTVSAGVVAASPLGNMWREVWDGRAWNVFLRRVSRAAVALFLCFSVALCYWIYTQRTLFGDSAMIGVGVGIVVAFVVAQWLSRWTYMRMDVRHLFIEHKPNGRTMTVASPNISRFVVVDEPNNTQPIHSVHFLSTEGATIRLDVDLHTDAEARWIARRLNEMLGEVRGTPMDLSQIVRPPKA